MALAGPGVVCVVTKGNREAERERWWPNLNPTRRIREMAIGDIPGVGLLEQGAGLGNLRTGVELWLSTLELSILKRKKY